MSDDPPTKNWWQTVPGVLTATAAMVTAVTGLILTLHQVGLIGGRTGNSPVDVSSPGVLEDVGEELSLQVSSGGRSSIAPDAIGAYSVALPGGAEIRSGELTYRILDARLEPYAPGSLSLKLSARLTNNQSTAVSFWDDQFRLVIDGVLRTPETYLNEAVNAHSSMDRTIEFVIPDTLTGAGLQMGKVGEGMPSLPLVFGASVKKD